MKKINNPLEGMLPGLLSLFCIVSAIAGGLLYTRRVDQRQKSQANAILLYQDQAESIRIQSETDLKKHKALAKWDQAQTASLISSVNLLLDKSDDFTSSKAAVDHIANTGVPAIFVEVYTGVSAAQQKFLVSAAGKVIAECRNKRWIAGKEFVKGTFPATPKQRLYDGKLVAFNDEPDTLKIASKMLEAISAAGLHFILDARKEDQKASHKPKVEFDAFFFTNGDQISKVKP